MGLSVFAWDGYFSLPCEACKKMTLGYKRGYSYCLGCPAWRRFDLEKGDDLHYMIYKCQHGHTFKISTSSAKDSKDLKEILLLGKDGYKPLEE